MPVLLLGFSLGLALGVDALVLGVKMLRELVGLEKAVMFALLLVSVGVLEVLVLLVLLARDAREVVLDLLDVLDLVVVVWGLVVEVLHERRLLVGVPRWLRPVTL